MIGIYCIKNKINGKCYIGSTNNLAYRKSMHFHKLKFNRHVNSHLQNSYNKYGVDSFEFSIIEIITKDKFNKDYLLIREQHYIDSVHPEYNILQIAGSNLGYNHSDWQFASNTRNIAAYISHISQKLRNQISISPEVYIPYQVNRDGIDYYTTKVTLDKVYVRVANKDYPLKTYHHWK
jgi:group I intron endonuclease